MKLEHESLRELRAAPELAHLAVLLLPRTCSNAPYASLTGPSSISLFSRRANRAWAAETLLRIHRFTAE